MPVCLKLVFWGYEFMQTEYLIVSLRWKCYFILCITKWCYICSTVVQSRLYKLKYCTRKYAESLEEMCCEELSAVSQETLMQSWKENFPHSRRTSHLHLQKFVNAVYSLCFGFPVKLYQNYIIKVCVQATEKAYGCFPIYKAAIVFTHL